nr:zinc finger, CCHC-type [Tanacetum cinerariifolium]
VETGVHRVHDEKRVWFEVELQGAQGDREANVFQRSTQQCMKSGITKHLGVAWIQQQNRERIQPGIWVSMRVRNKKIISSGVGTGSMQVLHGFEFEVEPQWDHTFEVEPQENVDQGAGLQEVQTQDLMDYQLAHDREQHIACELFGYREDSNKAAFAVAAVEKIYAHGSLTFNNTVACEVISKWKAVLKDCNTSKMGRSEIMSGSVTS